MSGEDIKNIYKKIRFSESLTLSSRDFSNSLRKEVEMAEMRTHPDTLTLAKMTRAAYDTEIQIPPGWLLLTTAEDTANGYHGLAAWQAAQRCVIIVHSGTQTLQTELFNSGGKLSWQWLSILSSAITFTHEVVEGVSREVGDDFELFLTGHSLGGWLAQVATYTIQFCTINEGPHKMFSFDKEKWKPHCEAFDPPGCRTMLEGLREFLEPSQQPEGSLEELDITVWLTAPNKINSFGGHIGRQFQLDLEGTDRSIDGILACLKQEELKPRVITSWPDVTKNTGTVTNYWGVMLKGSFDSMPKHAPLKEMKEQVELTDTVHLIRNEVCTNVMTKSERKVLQQYNSLRNTRKNLPIIYNDLFSRKCFELLSNYTISEDTLNLEGNTNVRQFVPNIRKLLQTHSIVLDTLTALNREEMGPGVTLKQQTVREARSQVVSFKSEDPQLTAALVFDEININTNIPRTFKSYLLKQKDLNWDLQLASKTKNSYVILVENKLTEEQWTMLCDAARSGNQVLFVSNNEHSEHIEDKCNSLPDLTWSIVDAGGIKWEDLSEESQLFIMEQKIMRFKGRVEKLSIKDLTKANEPQQLSSIMTTDLVRKILNARNKNKELDIILGSGGTCQSKVPEGFQHFERNLKEISNGTEISELDLLERSEKMTIITGSPGIGKTETLRYLCEELKLKYPKSWVVYISLPSHMPVFHKYKGAKEFSKFKWLVELIAKDHPMEAEESAVFEYCLTYDSETFMFFDGFDEIASDCEDIVTELLVKLKDVKAKRLFVTSREYKAQNLKEKLQAVSYVLNPLSNELVQSILEKGSKNWEVIVKFATTRGIKDVLHNPLVLWMLIDAMKDVKMEDNVNLFQIYHKFTDLRVDIYMNRCFTFTSAGDGGDGISSIIKSNLLDGLKNVALRQILLLDVRKHDMSNELYKTGLVEKRGDGDTFIHRTFAEYFVVVCVLEALNSGNAPFKLDLKEMVHNILDNEEHGVLRFLNDALLEFRGTSELLKSISEYVRGESDLKVIKNLEDVFIKLANLTVSSKPGETSSEKNISPLKQHSELDNMPLTVEAECSEEGGSDDITRITKQINNKTEPQSWMIGGTTSQWRQPKRFKFIERTFLKIKQMISGQDELIAELHWLKEKITILSAGSRSSRGSSEPGLEGFTGVRPDGEMVYPWNKLLKKDLKLQLSCQQFRHLLSKTAQLAVPRRQPDQVTLAKIADAAYKIKLGGQSEQDALPQGWDLLTMGWNEDWFNGYHGIAVWQPQHRCLVIAHKGTTLRSFNDLIAEFGGVMCKGWVRSIVSAATFVHTVVTEVSSEVGEDYQLFLTGHGLGGWLCQLTTYTVQFTCPQPGSNQFLRVAERCKPHCVAFDPPGCKDMLEDLVRHMEPNQTPEESLRELDIVSYLSLPNMVNVLNRHFGTVLQISYSPTTLSITNTEQTHSITNFVTEESYKNIQTVVNWPFFTERGDEAMETRGGYTEIPYQTLKYHHNTVNLNVFTKSERKFLQNHNTVFGTSNVTIDSDNMEIQACQRMLSNFTISDVVLTCTPPVTIHEFIPSIAKLLREHPLFILEQLSNRNRKKIGNKSLKFNKDIMSHPVAEKYKGKVVFLKAEDTELTAMRVLREVEREDGDVKLLLQEDLRFKVFINLPEGCVFVILVEEQITEKQWELIDQLRGEKNTVFLVASQEQQLPCSTLQCAGITLKDFHEDTRNALLDEKIVEFFGRQQLFTIREITKTQDPLSLSDVLTTPIITRIIRQMNRAEPQTWRIGRTSSQWRQPEGFKFIERTFQKKKHGKMISGEEEPITELHLLKDHKEKITIISAEPGLGKTQILRHLWRQIQQDNPKSLVIYMELSSQSCTQVFLEHKDTTDFFRSVPVETFIARDLLKLDGEERAMYEHCMRHESETYLLLDGFNEISPDYEDFVMEMLVAVKETKVKRVFVTSRNHLVEILENKLTMPSFALMPFFKRKH